MNVASQPIRFVLGNQVVEVSGLPPTTTVLNYLRTIARRPGTKEGCAEGDCGACTVVVGSLESGQLRLKSINACIQFLPTLDGKALFTVEDLRQPDGSLHPVQEAMVECHASQCGFCTPGFVMSLWNLYQASPAGSELNAGHVRRAISGNLCRCTGYRPIIEAGVTMNRRRSAALDRGSTEKLLRGLTRASAFAYAAGGQTFHAPRTLAELVELRSRLPGATLLAGGTDIGLWVNKQFRPLGDIIYTGEITELKQIRKLGGRIEIGAAVSLNDCWATIREEYPEFDEMWERFASEPIRNAGTLGGNVAKGSPIGDSMPALIAIGAHIVLVGPGGSRELPLEDLYRGYQQTALAPDEVLAYVTVPQRDTNRRVACYKLSKRFDSDISAVCAAFSLQVNSDRVTHFRAAFGGMAAVPKRAMQIENALIGKTWDEAGVQAAMSMMAADFTTLSDARASAEYRMTAAQNLLYRFFLETRREGALAPTQLRVFA